MHYAAIIIKSKKLDNVEARDIFGEILLNHSECDWYSTDADNCAFPTGDETISVEEYSQLSKMDEGYTVPIIILNDEGYDEGLIIPTNFWEFYDFPEERAVLLESYGVVYRKQVKAWLKKYKRKAYEVIMLDYHN